MEHKNISVQEACVFDGRKLLARHSREMNSCLYFHNFPTTKRKIIIHCGNTQLSLELQDLIGLGQEHPEYMMRLAIFSWQIYFLFQLTYRGKDGMYRKLTATEYAQMLFWDFADSPDEMKSEFVSEENREVAFRMYKAVCDAICPMIAHTGNSRFCPNDVAYLVNYIIDKQGKVSAPSLEGWGKPYPRNYPLPWNDNSLLPSAIMV